MMNPTLLKTKKGRKRRAKEGGRKKEKMREKIKMMILTKERRTQFRTYFSNSRSPSPNRLQRRHNHYSHIPSPSHSHQYMSLTYCTFSSQLYHNRIDVRISRTPLFECQVLTLVIIPGDLLTRWIALDNSCIFY